MNGAGVSTKVAVCVEYKEEVGIAVSSGLDASSRLVGTLDHPSPLASTVLVS